MTASPPARRTSRLVCPSCAAEHDASEPRFACACGALLDVEHDALDAAVDEAAHGVWRWRGMVHPGLPRGEEVTLGEGGVPLVASDALAAYTGLDGLLVQHEGRNPTGSFKDRGMTVAVSQARRTGARTVACASTGNTAASLAAYAGAAGLDAVVLAPASHTAAGKLAQARAHGARVLLLEGDFDAGLALVRAAAAAHDLRLLNSVDPWRVEGQKTIVLEMLERLGGAAPDWIVFPAGNLGNCAAFGKAVREACAVGLTDRAPRLAAVQAAGAAPFAAAFARGFDALEPVAADTVATAIRIGAPASYDRAVRAIRETNGVVTSVTDEELLDAKAAVDGAGLGAEPASCASVAGARALRADGTIAPDARVVCVLTGHLLKDPGDGGPAPVRVEATADALARALEA